MVISSFLSVFFEFSSRGHKTACRAYFLASLVLLATFKADLPAQDDFLATLQADHSVQDVLLATFQADLTVRIDLLTTFQVDLTIRIHLLTTFQADLAVWIDLSTTFQADLSSWPTKLTSKPTKLSMTTVCSKLCSNFLTLHTVQRNTLHVQQNSATILLRVHTSIYIYIYK